MDNNEWSNETKAAADNEVAIDYIKTNDFHVVWADGAIGGITPNGLLHIGLYAERQAIPRRQVYTIEKIDEQHGALGAEVIEKRISRNSIVREMSCDLMMSAESATSLANWILKTVGQIEENQDKE